MDLIWVGGEAKYFCGQDWTGSISLIRFNKSGCAGRPANLVPDQLTPLDTHHLRKPPSMGIASAVVL